MAKLNELSCAENTRNVGFGSCVLDPKIFVGALLYDAPRTFSQAELDDLQATLQADALNDTKSERVFPFHDFTNVTDNTEDVSITTTDYGFKYVTREGFYDLLFRFFNGASCVLSAARTHNGSRYVLFYDKDKNIYGYNSDEELAAIPVLFYAVPMRLATGADAAQYLLRFIFAPNYLNEDTGFVKADFDIRSISGLQDIKLAVNSFNQSTGLVNVTMQQLCGALNLYSLYSTDLVVGLIKATNGATGAVIAVTSITPIAGTQSFDIQLNASDPDYPTDGGSINLTLGAPSELAGAGIEGYESTTTKLTVSAS